MRGNWFFLAVYYLLYFLGEEMQEQITLACDICKNRNYISTKNKKNTPDRLQRKKYCRVCHKHTLHKETK
jgi:large subunit ribosomal protein L33